jgi:hypothetical protein
MRAAPGRAAAPRVIARILQRVGITFALVTSPATRSRIKVSTALHLELDAPF